MQLLFIASFEADKMIYYLFGISIDIISRKKFFFYFVLADAENKKTTKNCNHGNNK